ncbi:hypothetical protein WN944_023665 [Citrus x changshan-huyou]|uniref:Uncharacterized protein n=1 Tax=Citrus x changshan-huyou TaxID=2935761 RepID=A0AAP0N2N5_9ROSI
MVTQIASEPLMPSHNSSVLLQLISCGNLAVAKAKSMPSFKQPSAAVNNSDKNKNEVVVKKRETPYHILNANNIAHAYYVSLGGCVRIECKERNSLNLKRSIDGEIDSIGTYNIHADIIVSICMRVCVCV